MELEPLQVAGEAPAQRCSAFQLERNYFTAMCSGSEAGSYLRLIDFVYHSALGLRVLKEREEEKKLCVIQDRLRNWGHCRLLFCCLSAQAMTQTPTFEILNSIP